MPTTTPTNFLDLTATLIFLKTTLLIILLFYAIFALIVIRQVDLMSKTLITSLAPIVTFLSIIQFVLAIGLIILSWAIL